MKMLYPGFLLRWQQHKSHCKDGFRDDVVHNPKSFSELTSHRSIQEPGEPETSFLYVVFRDLPI